MCKIRVDEKRITDKLRILTVLIHSARRICMGLGPFVASCWMVEWMDGLHPRWWCARSVLGCSVDGVLLLRSVLRWYGFFFCELQTIVNTNHIENLNRTRYQETEKISYFDSAQFRSSSFFAASTIAMHMHINSFILNSNDVMT